MKKAQLPNIALLGTGGTIAATAHDATALSGYEVTEGIESLLKAVPGLETLANLQCKQVFNLDSRLLTPRHLLKLSALINRLLAAPEMDGVVVTHGTDTLEETAYFLNLTVKSNKPIVLVGAMRPGSALSADGPLNLYNAVLLATRPEARGLGVLVTLNDRVHAARYLSKTSTTQVDAFDRAEQACLGQLNNGSFHLFQRPVTAHTMDSEFDVSNAKTLPAVDIIYDYQGAAIHPYEASVQAGAHGIVVAAMGNGSLSTQAEKGLKLAVKNGLACVRSSRTGSGIVTPSASDARRGFVSANSLNPQKARILLMLSLAAGLDRAGIQRCFDRY